MFVVLVFSLALVFQWLQIEAEIQIIPYEDDHKVIRLNISIPKTAYHSITVISESNNDHCVYFSESAYDPSEFVVRPDPSIVHPADDIKPGCTYLVIFEDYNHTKREQFKIKVPECVGSQCDCNKYQWEVTLLGVENDRDEFRINWDPGAIPGVNKSHFITHADFNYFSNSSLLNVEPAEILELNLNQNYSRVKFPKSVKGKSYILSATFLNNFGCASSPSIEFSIPPSPSYILLIIALILILLVLLLRHFDLCKLLKKILKIVPGRYENVALHEQNIPLSTIGEGNTINMHPNTTYIPSEFLNGDIDKYEILRTKVELVEPIGEGAFGKVYKGILQKSDKDEFVAIKTLGSDPGKDDIEDFMAEINIFKKIGYHPNIVRLIGCCSINQPYLMLMEFVPCGDLKKYLVSLRDQWVQKTKTKFVYPNDSGGSYVLSQSPINSQNSSQVPTPKSTETATTHLNYVQLPPLERVLDHKELQNFALQIAKGMAYLEEIGITHRDLAARNILIGSLKTLKISDFGLSRIGPYTNQNKRKMPFRWMAIESIENHQYDSKSDVWSFAVVLWEIGNLGAFPYETMPDSLVLYNLKIGNRLARPEICTDELYELMLKCWTEEPELRPSFKELVTILDKKKIYVDFAQLNPMYVFPPVEEEVGDV